MSKVSIGVAVPDYSLTEPLLVVMAQGGKRLLLGDRTYAYRAGQCLKVTANLPVTGPRRTRRRRSARSADRAGDPMAVPDRPAGRHTAPDRARGQRSDPRQSRDRLDKGQLCRADADRRPRRHVRHERVGLSPPVPRRNRHEPLAVSETHPAPQARSLLVAKPRDVAGVGHLVGYDSPSQFTREYRRLFGAPPAQHAARRRGSPRSSDDWRFENASSVVNTPAVSRDRCNSPQRNLDGGRALTREFGQDRRDPALPSSPPRVWPSIRHGRGTGQPRSATVHSSLVIRPRIRLPVGRPTVPSPPAPCRQSTRITVHGAIDFPARAVTTGRDSAGAHR